MELGTVIDGTHATISLDGNLTVAASPSLEAALSDLPGDVVDVTLDLADLDYIASSGLRVMVSQYKKLNQKGGSLRLVNPNEEVMEVLHITGLAEALSVQP